MKGMARGLAPKLCDEGEGGSYVIRGFHGRNIAVFKPEDEEPFAPCNPKGYV